ncbi:MAG: hypothetical protein KME55_02490 [Nostoc indistinguendum CM1-VF10]|jgi:light-regulated signal transduction histidine kinase (bacteriophytochrome)|nr:hypothetical protein [Nostoc indistinguendum CM1-VF10]
MPYQTQGSNFQAVSGDIAAVQSNRKGWFSRLTNGLSVGNKIKCGYALALSVGILGTTIGLIFGEHYQEKALQEQQNAFKELNLLYRLQTSILQTRTHQQQLIPLVPYPKLYTEEYAHITNVHAPEIEQVWSELQKYIKNADYAGENHIENIPLFLKTYDGLAQTYIRQLKELLQQLELSPLTQNKIAIAQQRLLKFTNSELAIKFDGIQERIFETFFTTKARGIGTGMGLSISHQIVVEKHGGQLMCKSEVGSGTEFIISLPIQKHHLSENAQV